MGGMSFKKMARQLGIDEAEFGEQGEQMWSMLDDLATNDPEAYDAFVKQQMDEHAEDAKKPKGKHFIPEAGFVIKILKSDQIKVFLNVCHHQAVQRPRDHADRPVTDDPRQPTDGMEIPMAIGQVRECNDNKNESCLAVDVAVHPWVTSRCESDRGFKREVMKLAIDSVASECSLKLVRPGKLIQSRYKGGEGENGTKPVPFMIDIDEQGRLKRGNQGAQVAVPSGTTQPAPDQTSNQHSQNSGANPNSRWVAGSEKQKKDEVTLPIQEMEDPSDLMKQLGDLSDFDGISSKGKANNEGSDIAKLQLPGSAPNAQKKRPKGPLIQEMNEDGTFDEPKSDSQSEDAIIHEMNADGTFDISGDAPVVTKPSTSKPKPKRGKGRAVKKGFLNSTKTKTAKPLYPEGSTEGRAEHPWNKLMGRSKVVDMNEMTPAQQAQYMKGRGGPQKSAKSQAPQNNAGVDWNNMGVDEMCDRVIDMEKEKLKEKDHADAEFEELMNAAEPDYALYARRKQAAADEANAELAKFANMLSDEVPGSKKPSPDSDSSPAKAPQKDNTEQREKEAARKVHASAVDYSKFEKVPEDWDPEEEAARKADLAKRIAETKLKVENERARRGYGDGLEELAKKAEKKKKKKKAKSKATGTMSALAAVHETKTVTADDSDATATNKNGEQSVCAPDPNPDQGEVPSDFVKSQRAKEEDYWARKLAQMKQETEDRELTASPCADDAAGTLAQTGIAENDVEEDEILEIGSDGTFDMDAPAKKKQPPAFNFKGKLGGGGTRSTDKKQPNEQLRAKETSQAVRKAGEEADMGAGHDVKSTPQYSVKISKSKGHEAVVVVIKLPGCESLKGMDLQVNSTDLRLRVDNFRPLGVPLPQKVNEDTVKAKFSSKKQELTVRIHTYA